MINADRLLQTFLDLVQIDNVSGQEAAIATHVRGVLESLGLQTTVDERYNVIAHVPGEGEPILLNAHLDSVTPCQGVRPIVADGVVRSSGDTVLGADDLAGVAAIIEGVRSTLERGGTHRAADILFTVQEETGLVGAATVDLNLFQARSGFTFDAGGEFGGITIGAPSQDSLHIIVRGRASHAGVAPELGISAITVAGHALARMPLGRIDFETTANIGIIQGGSATNIVTPLVEMWGEARSHDQEKLVAQVKAMVVAVEDAARQFGADVEIEISHQYDAYRFDTEHPLVQQAAQELQAMGVEPRFEVSGGGSDVNMFINRGLNIVNLSVGYQEIHSTNEWIALTDLNRTAELVARLLDNSPLPA